MRHVTHLLAKKRQDLKGDEKRRKLQSLFNNVSSTFFLERTLADVDTRAQVSHFARGGEKSKETTRSFTHACTDMRADRNASRTLASDRRKWAHMVWRTFDTLDCRPNRSLLSRQAKLLNVFCC